MKRFSQRVLLSALLLSSTLSLQGCAGAEPTDYMAIAALGIGVALIPSLLDVGNSDKEAPSPEPAVTQAPNFNSDAIGRIGANVQVFGPEHTPLSGAQIKMSFHGESAQAESNAAGMATIFLSSHQTLAKDIAPYSQMAQITVSKSGFQTVQTSKALQIIFDQPANADNPNYSGTLVLEVDLTPQS